MMSSGSRNREICLKDKSSNLSMKLHNHDNNLGMFFSVLDSFSLGPFDILHEEKIQKKLRYFRLPPNFGPQDVNSGARARAAEHQEILVVGKSSA